MSLFFRPALPINVLETMLTRLGWRSKSSWSLIRKDSNGERRRQRWSCESSLMGWNPTVPKSAGKLSKQQRRTPTETTVQNSSYPPTPLPFALWKKIKNRLRSFVALSMCSKLIVHRLAQLFCCCWGGGRSSKLIFHRLAHLWSMDGSEISLCLPIMTP